MKKILSCVVSALIGLAVSSVAQAAAVFPKVIENNAPYDGVVDNIEFSVSGTFFEAGTDAEFNTGDSVLLLLKPISVDAVAVSENFGIVIAAAAGTSSSGSFFNLVPITGGLPSLFPSVAGTIAPGAIAVALGSDTLDFSSITDPLLLNNAAVNAEFSLLNDGVDDLARLSGVFNGVNETLFTLGFQGTVAANNLASLGTPTNFRPQTLTTTIPPSSSTFDFRIRTDGLTSKVFAASITSSPPASYMVSGLALGAVNPLPEPASMVAMIGCVVGGFAFRRRARKS